MISQTVSTANIFARASRLAYSIQNNSFDFTQENVENDVNLVNLDMTTLKTYQSPNEIDACYFCKTFSGNSILSFRGTLPPTEIFNDYKNVLPVLRDLLNDGEVEQVSSDLWGKVHHGFLKSLDSLLPIITKLDLHPSKNFPDRKLYITGHSKGGALAFLTAACLIKTNQIKPNYGCVYTYAAPRVGDYKFATEYNRFLINSTKRFEYQDDLVPHLPPNTGLWSSIVNTVLKKDGRFPVSTDLSGLFKQFNQVLQKIEDYTHPLQSYTSAGKLQFLNWDSVPIIEEESESLDFQRNLYLPEAFLPSLNDKSIKFISDHCIDTYINAL